MKNVYSYFHAFNTSIMFIFLAIVSSYFIFISNHVLIYKVLFLLLPLIPFVFGILGIITSIKKLKRHEMMVYKQNKEEFIQDLLLKALIVFLFMILITVEFVNKDKNIYIFILLFIYFIFDLIFFALNQINGDDTTNL